MKRALVQTVTWLVMLGEMVIGMSQLPACHTIEGAGKDVSAAGQGIADTADRARPYD
jgi:predicted small secreted protein